MVRDDRPQIPETLEELEEILLEGLNSGPDIKIDRSRVATFA